MITPCDDDHSICPYRLFMRYYNKCLESATKYVDGGRLTGRVFRKWITRRKDGGYYNENQVMGVGPVGEIFKDILMEYKMFLPDDVQWEIEHGRPDVGRKNKGNVRIGVNRYTSHTGRRTMATIMAEKGFSAAEITAALRHKSQSTAQEYIDSSGVVRKSTSIKLMKTITAIGESGEEKKKEPKKIDRAHPREKSPDSPDAAGNTDAVFKADSSQLFNFSNCNVTIQK
ncbi:hypothetical protein AKO1_002671 [Acrasis kona]|uniref:Tyr recombinase domain-containing protein n=1 Tax=Acrasis kona TaxID=1008807 RepID=A0AAW2ZQL7_9EUKA